MKRTTLRKTLIAAALASVGAFGTAALAHQGGYGPGWGMMGGYGMGYGMGPGMMGGYGGYGMGPGMMGGHGGYGMGPGMMWGYGPGGGLNLSDEQRSKVGKIQEDTSRKQWDLMSKMQRERARLNELYYSDKRDDAAISKTYKNVSELRQQMFENSLAARKQIDAVLTKEQRDQSRRGGCGAWGY